MVESYASSDPSSPTPSRERLRFTDCTFLRTPSGHCRAEVELELEGRRMRAVAEGPTSPVGDLRYCAEAAVRAIEHFVGASLPLELIGVKVVRAFDANLVIVHLTRKDQPGAKLLGVYLTEGDVTRGAALAVLNATNRVIGNHFSTT